MKVIPILFNTDMVRATLEDRKTVTRRVVKPQPKMRLAYRCMGHGCGKWSYPSEYASKFWGAEWKRPDGISAEDEEMLWSPPCHTDDILYVRETWAKQFGICWHKAGLKVDEKGYCKDGFWDSAGNWVATKAPEKWRPSIHMPKEAARLFLRVTDVQVERLQDITEAGAISEGFMKWGEYTEIEVPARSDFCNFWDSTIKSDDLPRYGWEANPWVWVIAFERCEKPEGWCEVNKK